MPVRQREHFNQAHRILCKKLIIMQRQPAPVELETVQLLRPPRDAWQKTAPACGKGIIKVRQKNAGNIADHLRVQEIILHEPHDRRFTLPLGKAHPCRDLLLQIERSEEHTSELQSLMRIAYAV